MEGKDIDVDWSRGYSEGAVGITELGKSCAAGTAEKVKEVEDALKAGTFHVFDTSKFTVEGKKVTSNVVDFSYLDFTTNPPTVVYQGEQKETVKTAGDVSYVEESVIRSAPYFSLKIDGITWLN